MTTVCGWIFAQHFCNRLGPAYLQLKNVLDENDATHVEVLDNIKRRLREESFTRESIAQVIHAYPELVSTMHPLALLQNSHHMFQIQLLYVNFAMKHYPTNDAPQLIFRPTLSNQRLQSSQQLTDEELYDKMRRTVQNKHDFEVLESLLIFNRCVKKK